MPSRKEHLKKGRTEGDEREGDEGGRIRGEGFLGRGRWRVKIAARSRDQNGNRCGAAAAAAACGAGRWEAAQRAGRQDRSPRATPTSSAAFFASKVVMFANKKKSQPGVVLTWC